VQVINATIQGGTLNTLGGGTVASAGTTATLDGTTHGALTISAGKRKCRGPNQLRKTARGAVFQFTLASEFFPSTLSLLGSWCLGIS
jgi:hypothetical protein